MSIVDCRNFEMSPTGVPSAWWMYLPRDASKDYGTEKGLHPGEVSHLSGEVGTWLLRYGLFFLRSTQWRRASRDGSRALRHPFR